MAEEDIQQIVAGHEARNKSLMNIFVERRVDLRVPRTIECHFWAQSQESASAIARALSERGFRILVQGPVHGSENPNKWNVEAEVNQSIDLTMRREFTDELVRLANTYGGKYDGWGTLV